MEERIFHMAGATTPEEQTVATLRRVISEAGRDPVQRDSHYRHLNDRAHDLPSKPHELVCA
jgi:aminodeoxyfutalosine synthase